MEQVSYSSNGGPEVLCYEPAPDPTPGPGELLVATRAIAIEGGDLMHREQVPPSTAQHVVGYSQAGVVVAVGPEVTGFVTGQRVATFGAAGSHASMRVVGPDETWLLPDGVDFAAGACVPVAFGTAHEALFGHGQLQAGQTVLIQGAAGGVGLAAVQLARNAGARVIGTSSSLNQLDQLRHYGLDDGIDYRSEDVVARVMELTDGRGVDLAIDPVGGEQHQQVVDCVTRGGRIVLVGVAGRSATMLDAMSILIGEKVLSGFMLGQHYAGPRIHEMVNGLLAELAAGKLEAVVDRTFALSDAKSAHAYAEQRGRVGRVVMTA